MPRVFYRTEVPPILYQRIAHATRDSRFAEAVCALLAAPCRFPHDDAVQIMTERLFYPDRQISPDEAKGICFASLPHSTEKALRVYDRRLRTEKGFPATHPFRIVEQQ